ncbi:uncharacterized protein LOC141849125 isoform X2 [Brevipalpus obovatus]|uniref:uncharacterized protein LOC141849125 isoform X2 n=1 Tax=Brevipalpus obovatus TaxID=246614 RepID=UPI003D9E9A40
MYLMALPVCFISSIILGISCELIRKTSIHMSTSQSSSSSFYSSSSSIGFIEGHNDLTLTGEEGAMSDGQSISSSDHSSPLAHVFGVKKYPDQREYKDQSSSRVLMPLMQSRSSSKFLSQAASILYTAVVKGKVALPCDVTAPTSDDSVALVLWYKDDALAPIYTLDARKGKLEQARRLKASSLEGRAYFNLQNRPAFLQIDPIKLSDAGDYRCRVDFKKARTVNTVISLKVIVPPEEPMITDTQGNDLKGLIGPFNEGDELRLICVTVGGKPRPSLTWWRDDVVIDDSFEYNDKDVTTNQLMIGSLARHYLLSIFTCQAINNNITVPSSTSITLDLNLKPTEVHINQLTPVLAAEREATFECSTYGSRPKAILYWIFEGQRYNTPLSGDHQTSTSITLLLKKSHNNAMLTCNSENLKIAASTISNDLRLDVHYVPHVSLRLGSPTISLQTIQEGNDIYFDCVVDANPTLNRPIIWRFNGQILHPQHGIIQSNQTLVLQRVSRKQSGTYQCEASNQQGGALSNTINLTIRYAPVCRSDYFLVYGVPLHETVNLQCDVDANPSRVSFHWNFSDRSESLPFEHINETSSALSYAPHETTDFGIIECIAKNDVGLQQRACTFHITSSDPPHLAFRCRIANQSDDSLAIHCLPDVRVNYTSDEIRSSDDDYQPSRGLFIYPSSVFICQVYRKNEPYPIINASYPLKVPYKSHSYELYVMHDNDIKFYLTKLTPSTHYRIHCFSQHLRGRSEGIWISAETLQQAQKLVGNGDGQSSMFDGASNLFTGRPMLMGLLISIIVVSLVLIVLGILAILRIRNHRHIIQLPRPTAGIVQYPPQTEQSGNDGTVFNEDGEVDCCCGDNLCDEVVLTSGTVQQHQYSVTSITSDANKGPPDIIPSIGYLPQNDLDKDQKKFVNLDESDLDISSYDYTNSKHTFNVSLASDQMDRLKNKQTRVDLISGSPKIESTV